MQVKEYFDREKLPLTEDVQIGNLILQVKASAMLDEQGEFEGIVLEIINVTRARRISTEREKAIDELRVTVEELDQFAYVASHDLRSPLPRLSQNCLKITFFQGSWPKRP